MAKGIAAGRSGVEAQVKSAIAKGQSASAWINSMKKAGLSYRRQTMLADFRAIGEIKAKEGLMQFVRKNYKPSAALVADVNWNLSREYMYKVRVETRLAPGEKPESRFVNIVNDRPMTPAEIDTEVRRMWEVWYESRKEEVLSVIPETAYRKVV